ncbi:MAG TPA: citrate (Si)-synthase [Saprospiraceae bacterium]|nr:citrate (Si)-synthase [Saprospiraceae bacterium]
MNPLKEIFYNKAIAVREELKNFNKTYGENKIDTVSASQLTGGMRNIKSMLWETSLLDPAEGIRFRGYSIPELIVALPKALGDTEPLPEGLFWLMLTGEIPSAEQVQWLSKEWAGRSGLDQAVTDVLDALPTDTHPMTQFSMAIMASQRMSIFAKSYDEGMNKADYWDPMFEDTMNLIARLPQIAAYIYRRSFHDGNHIAADPNLDWGANFANMLGFNKPDFVSYLRLYLTIHADHEGGNASAHATHLTGSTLSDAYLSLCSGMNALAGPLHGLANQEVLNWINELVDKIGTLKPTKEQIAEYVQTTLAEGKVVPGYGHAVLRKPDPRFMEQKRFAEQYIPDGDYVNIVWKVFEVVPGILSGLGKVANPWPNVDAHSGAVLMYYDLKETSFYTVLFGVSRAMGVLAQLCWSRMLGLPLERPKSITFEALKKQINT